MLDDGCYAHYAERVVVVDVARSRPKIEREGPLIGDAVCRKLAQKLNGHEPDHGDRCLVLGYGTIGAAVAESLVTLLNVPRDRVYVLDPVPERCDAARAAGFGIWEREPVRFKLVVGCSGTTSFGIGDRVFLEDGAVLASASSGSAELSRERFVDSQMPMSPMTSRSSTA